MNIQHLFPVPIGMFELNRELTKEELNFVNSEETKENEGNLVSINSFVLKNAKMNFLNSWIEDCVSKYFIATTNPKNDVDLKITQSWFNYSKQGQYHHKHSHPNSFVSGVFYLNTNLDDKIFFSKSGWQQIKFEPKEWNLFNSDSWWFEAITGRLILFPSWLEHNVPPIQGKETRVSLSFNTFPTGFIGDESKLTALNLEV